MLMNFENDSNQNGSDIKANGKIYIGLISFFFQLLSNKDLKLNPINIFFPGQRQNSADHCIIIMVNSKKKEFIRKRIRSDSNERSE